MSAPRTPESTITIQSVVFDEDAVSITYAETADVHLVDGQPVIATHVYTVSRDSGLGPVLRELEELAEDTIVAVTRAFDQAPSLADAARNAADGDEDEDGSDGEDPYRGLGD